MTEDALIETIFDKEGRRFEDAPITDQPTAAGGIILPTLTEYRGRLCTVDDLRALTLDEAHVIVRWILRRLAAAEGIDKIQDEPLRLQMIYFAYNSGARLAYRWLQRVLQVPRTGRMDAVTLAGVNAAPSVDDGRFWLHQALIAARLQMIDGATDPGGKVDHKFEEGLESRALTFSRLVIP